MKRLIFTLIPLLLRVTFSFAQEDTTGDDPVFEDESSTLSYRQNDMFRLLQEPRGQIGLHFLTTPFMKQQAFGGAIDLTLRYTQNLSAGLNLMVAGRKVQPDFGYIIGEPLLTYYDISLFNEFQFLQWHGLHLGVRLYTGLSVFNLADNSIKEIYTWYDEYGIAYEGERALSIDKNYFMRIAPEFTVQYHISRGFAIEAGAAYNFFVGSPQFGSNSDFRNYQLRAGFGIQL